MLWPITELTKQNNAKLPGPYDVYLDKVPKVESQLPRVSASRRFSTHFLTDSQYLEIEGERERERERERETTMKREREEERKGKR